jgi:hypothetical protein
MNETPVVAGEKMCMWKVDDNKMSVVINPQIKADARNTPTYNVFANMFSP